MLLLCVSAAEETWVMSGGAGAGAGGTPGLLSGSGEKVWQDFVSEFAFVRFIVG